jgi:hypothetical protein
MATSRRFTKGVTAAVAARAPKVEKRFDRLIEGDEVRVLGKHGRFRFLNATFASRGGVDHLTLLGPLGDRQMMRAIEPCNVKIPSQRALNLQRKRRAEDG